MVQTEAQYKFIYLALKHYKEIETKRRSAQRSSENQNRDVSTDKYNKQSVMV